MPSNATEQDRFVAPAELGPQSAGSAGSAGAADQMAGAELVEEEILVEEISIDGMRGGTAAPVAARETVASLRSSAVFATSLAAELDPQESLRDEPFGALAYNFGTCRLRFFLPSRSSATTWSAHQLQYGLHALICLTWEVTYGCNLACVHCLSSSGRRDPRELSTAEAVRFLDELAEMQVFYVNVGGGEPLLRPDFFDLLGHASRARVGVKFSTNGTLITPARARRLASMDYLDVQLSVDGARPESNDPVRGSGSFDAAGDGHGRGG